jgi:hypothetical protein
MVWCSGRSRDPALSWLRDRLRPIVKRNFESQSAGWRARRQPQQHNAR